MSALGSDGFSRQNAPVEHFERVSEQLCCEGRTTAHRPRSGGFGSPFDGLRNRSTTFTAVGKGLPALPLFYAKSFNTKGTSITKRISNTSAGRKFAVLIFAVLLMTDLIAAKENRTVKLNSGYEMPTLSHLLAKSLKKGKL